MPMFGGVRAPPTLETYPEATSAWEHAWYEGCRVNWVGGDGYWANDGINNMASSYQNNCVSGPGIPSHVRIYDGFWQAGTYLICIPPGTVLGYNGPTNDRASSHRWRTSC
jgi:hypothetical protein